MLCRDIIIKKYSEKKLFFMKIYSCSMMKKIEENANRRGMSYITMMENAGKACFDLIMKTVIGSAKPTVCVLCGKGKNGGDGFVIANHLKTPRFPLALCSPMASRKPTRLSP